jgi:hypothetical protein
MQCAKSLILSGKSCGTHRRAPFDRKPGRGVVADATGHPNESI